MARGYNTSKRSSRNNFSKSFIFQSKKVPLYRGGRRIS